MKQSYKFERVTDVSYRFAGDSGEMVERVNRKQSANTDRFLYDTVPSSSSSLITMSYIPSILMTVAGNDNNRLVSRKLHPASLDIVFTFLGTLQPLVLGGIDGGHLGRLPGWSADASAVHSSDTEVVRVAQVQAVNRVFTNIHWGVVALDPDVASSFTPVNHTAATKAQYLCRVFRLSEV